MKEKVLMIILDAFSSNYLKRELCPHLYDLAKEHYFSKMEPMFGFQGVGAAIYSGAPSNITGVFTEFILQKNELVERSRLFKTLLRLTDKMPTDNLCAKSRHVLLKMFGKKRSPISNVIPSQLFGYFSPKLKKEFTEENSLGQVPTIFDTLRLNNMSYELQRPAPRSEEAAVSGIVERVEKGKMPDVTIVHPCSLDLVGHDFGPNSPEMRSAVRNTDKLAGRIISSVESSAQKITTIFLSDHGMSPVNSTIDLLKTLERLPLTVRNDYLLFLDSTMARFWFFTERAGELIFEALGTLDCGKTLSTNDMQKLGIDRIGQEYGDLFFALKEGYAIFPDFFRKHTPPKGMHGYAFPTYDAPIVIIHSQNGSLMFDREKAVRYIDITPTILELLDLRAPQICQGESLLH